MKRIEMHHYDMGETNSRLKLRQLDSVFLGNGKTFYFRSSRKREYFFWALNKMLNESFVDMLQLQTRVVGLYNEIFLFIDDYNGVPKIQNELSMIEKTKEQVFYMNGPNANSMIYRKFYLILEGHEDILSILHKNGLRLKNYHVVSSAAAHQRSVEHIRARLNDFTFDCYKVTESTR